MTKARPKKPESDSVDPLRVINIEGEVVTLDQLLAVRGAETLRRRLADYLARAEEPPRRESRHA